MTGIRTDQRGNVTDMRFPSGDGGATTSTVGFFDVSAEDVAEWIAERFGQGWRVSRTTFHDATESQVLDALAPGTRRDKLVCVPLDSWCIVLTNGHLGTDLGVIPVRVARTFGRRAISATDTGDAVTYPARIFGVYGPNSLDGSGFERVVSVAKDGSRWSFQLEGKPFDFEQVDRYSERRVRDRLTSDMLAMYLAAIGVPAGPPAWGKTILVKDERPD